MTLVTRCSRRLAVGGMAGTRVRLAVGALQ